MSAKSITHYYVRIYSPAALEAKHAYMQSLYLNGTHPWHCLPLLQVEQWLGGPSDRPSTHTALQVVPSHPPSHWRTPSGQQ